MVTKMEFQSFLLFFFTQYVDMLGQKAFPLVTCSFLQSMKIFQDNQWKEFKCSGAIPATASGHQNTFRIPLYQDNSYFIHVSLFIFFCISLNSSLQFSEVVGNKSCNVSSSFEVDKVTLQCLLKLDSLTQMDSLSD